MTRYVRPTIAGWLLPTLFGPWLSLTAAITLAAAFGSDFHWAGRLIGWGLAMVLASLWAALYVAMLVVVDLLLLGAKVRTLPSQARAWAHTTLSPLAVLATYALLPARAIARGGPWVVGAAVLLPMVLAAAVTRIAFGVRPPR